MSGTKSGWQRRFILGVGFGVFAVGAAAAVLAPFLGKSWLLSVSGLVLGFRGLNLAAQELRRPWQERVTAVALTGAALCCALVCIATTDAWAGVIACVCGGLAATAWQDVAEWREERRALTVARA